MNAVLAFKICICVSVRIQIYLCPNCLKEMENALEEYIKYKKTQ